MSANSENIPSADPIFSPTLARRRYAENVLHKAQEQEGMTLVVDGLAGMGKTFLLRNLMIAADLSSQAKTTFVRADQIESTEPYSFIERFIASGLMPDWLFVPEETTSAVEVARECIRRLVHTNNNRLQVVVIDDAQWIDPESQRVLRYVIPRVSRRNVLLAFGVRSPHTNGSFGEFLVDLVSSDPTDEFYSVKPLSRQEISALAIERLGVSIPVSVAERVLDETGGSFLAIDSLANAFTSEDKNNLHISWGVPVSNWVAKNDPLLYQFSQLTKPVQATCEIVSLAKHELRRDDMARVADILGEDLWLEEAIASGVLTEAGFDGTIMPKHALLSEAINSTVDPERSRAIYAALASITTGYRSLHHTILAVEELDDSLLEKVNTFAQDEANRGNYGVASEVLRTALNKTTNEETRADLMVSLALVHIRAKTAYLILDLLPEFEKLPYTPLHEFICIVLSAHNVGLKLPLERVQKLLMSECSDPVQRTVISFFAFMVVILTMRSDQIQAVPTLIDQAKMLFQASPANPDEISDKRVEWMVSRDAYTVILDCYLMVQDQMHGAIEKVAETLPILLSRVNGLPDSSLKVDALVAISGAQLSLGNIVLGRSLIEEAIEMIPRVGEPWAASTSRLILADCLVMQGEYDEATELMQLTEELAYHALDVETRSTWAALQIKISAITGHGDVEQLLELSRNQRHIPWEGYAPDLSLLAECELARARGDNKEILALTDSAWAKGFSNTRHGFLTYRAHALIDSGLIYEATELIDDLAQRRGLTWQEYWGTLDWLRAKLAQASGDPETARWHYELATQNIDLKLPFALTMADYGAFLVEQGKTEQGTTIIQTAVAKLEEINAESYLKHIREKLQLTPQEPKNRKTNHLLTGLTDRERQIVDHLKKGRSNNQIAESLVVSVTTVRSHVSNVLRKMQLSSRGEVARMFRDQ